MSSAVCSAEVPQVFGMMEEEQKIYANAYAQNEFSTKWNLDEKYFSGIERFIVLYPLLHTAGHIPYSAVLDFKGLPL